MKLPLVNIDVAEALKELGFNWKVKYFWDCNSPDNVPYQYVGEDNYNDDTIFSSKCYYSAPEQAMAVKWFRDTHNIIITIDVNCSQNDFSFGYDWYIWRHSKYGYIEEYSTPTNCPIGEWTYSSYEEAELEGIKVAIKYLKCAKQ